MSTAMLSYKVDDYNPFVENGDYSYAKKAFLAAEAKVKIIFWIHRTITTVSVIIF